MKPGLLSILIICIIELLADVYLFKRLRSNFGYKRFYQSRLFAWLYWSFSIGLVFAVLIAIFGHLGIGAKSGLILGFFVFVLFRLILLPFVVAGDVRLFNRAKQNKTSETNNLVKEIIESKSDNDISRSQFLMKAGLITASAVPVGGLIYGVASGNVYDYHVNRVNLYLPNLPKAFDGLKLAQISDIHSGSFFNKKAVTGGIDILMREKADLIFFTGDLVNNKANEMRDYQDIFSNVKAPLGVFSSLGNHDYGDYCWWPYEQARAKNFNDLVQTHKNMGWRLLRNENTRLKVDGEEIAIVGVENWGKFSHYPSRGDLDLAMKHTDDAPVKLLLSHDPTHWRAKVLPNYPQIDVAFAGHTHGMQMGIYNENMRWSPIEYVYPEWAGLYREKQQQLYVNVGYGFIAYAGRLGILPEITIFELKASADPAFTNNARRSV